MSKPTGPTTGRQARPRVFRHNRVAGPIFDHALSDIRYSGHPQDMSMNDTVLVLWRAFVDARFAVVDWRFSRATERSPR